MTEFLRFGAMGSEIPAVRTARGVFDLRSLTSDIDGPFLAADGLRRARQAAQEGQLDPLDVSGLRWGAPIARPMAVICIGQNYAAHAAESGDKPPSRPIIFFKHPNTVVGPFDDVFRPPGAEALDWEVELAVVIGRRSRYLETTEDAMAAIAGYAISHDVSERNWQRNLSGGQWSKGKSAETFNPLGPWLVPSDEVDVSSLRIWSSVNGEPRQDSSTKDLIFSVGEIVRDLSNYLVLEPGDVINTGTPQGVALSGNFPYLRDGDLVEMGIDGLGVARQRIVPAP